MTLAQLHALMEVHNDVHSDKGSSRSSSARVSKNPAADLAQLGVPI